MESREARLTPIVQANSARAAAWRVFFERRAPRAFSKTHASKRTYGFRALQHPVDPLEHRALVCMERLA